MIHVMCFLMQGQTVQQLYDQQTSDDCCSACKTASGCNTWVYCPLSNGCDNAGVNTYPFGSCTLKYQQQVSWGGTPESWASNTDFLSGDQLSACPCVNRDHWMGNTNARCRALRFQSLEQPMCIHLLSGACLQARLEIDLLQLVMASASQCAASQLWKSWLIV